jgi:hypothetical protein
VDKNSQDKIKLDDLQLSAVVVSTTIIVFFVIYWAAQIETTYSLLAMAYGW